MLGETEPIDWSSYFHWVYTLNSWVSLLSGPIIVLLILIWVIRKYLVFRWHHVDPSVLFEITPPVSSKRTPHATEEFNRMIYALGSHKTKLERLLGRSRAVAFELTSSRRDGIRFIVRVSKNKAATFQQMMTSYVVGAKCEPVEDYLPNALVEPGAQIRLKEYMQAKDFILPLAPHDALSQHDPIAYITGSMTKPEAGELTTYQLVVEPVRLHRVTRANTTLLTGKLPNFRAKNRNVFWRAVFYVPTIPVKVLRVIFVELLKDHVYEQKNRQPPSQNQLDLMKSIGNKLNQPLFKVSILLLLSPLIQTVVCSIARA